MSFIEIVLVNLTLILGLMTLLWVISLILKNSSIVDIFWGFGFVVSTWLIFVLTSEGFLFRKLILSLLVTTWGLRLSIHILKRNWGKEEDFRYQAWRKEAGKSWWWRSYFQVFILQGFLMWVIAIPLIAAQIGTNSNKVMIWDVLGIIVWVIGFFFEVVGDVQLARFKANPANKGKVMNQGVWRYTRHPNYFGDATQWWGYFLIAISAGGWWTIFSPILMTLFLLRVSGVVLLEKTLESRPGYKEYIARTSAFIPWFPRK
jgi:steroid 5-alpha reductase family enzyme